MLLKRGGARRSYTIPKFPAVRFGCVLAGCQERNEFSLLEKAVMATIRSAPVRLGYALGLFQFHEGQHEDRPYPNRDWKLHKFGVT